MHFLIYILAVLPSLILIFIGICIKRYKAYNLISGYNTMSAEKKKNVDVEGLGNLMAYFCYMFALLIFLFILFLILKLVFFSIAIIAMFLISLIFTLIMSQKFDGNAINKDGSMKTKTKVILSALIVFFVIIFSGVGFLLFKSYLPTEYELSGGDLKIHSLYGERVPFKDITSIQLFDEIPQITRRTNGSAIGNILKGYFNVKEIGKVKLFVNTKIPYCIYIKTSSKTFLFNCQSIEETKDLFGIISKSLSTHS